MLSGLWPILWMWLGGFSKIVKWQGFLHLQEGVCLSVIKSTVWQGLVLSIHKKYFRQDISNNGSKVYPGMARSLLLTSAHEIHCQLATRKCLCHRIQEIWLRLSKQTERLSFNVMAVMPKLCLWYWIVDKPLFVCSPKSEGNHRRRGIMYLFLNL